MAAIVLNNIQIVMSGILIKLEKVIVMVENTTQQNVDTKKVIVLENIQIVMYTSIFVIVLEMVVVIMVTTLQNVDMMEVITFKNMTNFNSLKL